MSKAIQMLTLGTVLLIAACKETAQPAFDDGTGLSETFDRDTLTIENDDGEQLQFDVYLALEHEQTPAGLDVCAENAGKRQACCLSMGAPACARSG